MISKTITPKIINGSWKQHNISRNMYDHYIFICLFKLKSLWFIIYCRARNKHCTKMSAFIPHLLWEMKRSRRKYSNYRIIRSAIIGPPSHSLLSEKYAILQGSICKIRWKLVKKQLRYLSLSRSARLFTVVCMEDGNQAKVHSLIVFFK